MKIVCAHLLNDYSGSPLVLRQVVEGFINKGYEVDIYTSSGKASGFLSDVPGATSFSFPYKWQKNKLFRLVWLFYSQAVLFFMLLKYARKETIIYVNTVLPFGAALAGRVMGKKVVYHVHETSMKPELLKRFLFKVVSLTASDTIYVSNYLKSQEPVENSRMHKVYNALSETFIKKSTIQYRPLTETFNVLMICSLKDYKGVREYQQLAGMLPEIHFTLVLNSSEEEITRYFSSSNVPSNLFIYPTQTDVHPFYAKSDLVVNLSHPLKWVETFGLTALEAMQYGKPVIVPPVGGIAELVEHGTQGYKDDVRDLESIRKHVLMLSEDKWLYNQMSVQARRRANDFSIERMNAEIANILKPGNLVLEDQPTRKEAVSQNETSDSFLEKQSARVLI